MDIGTVDLVFVPDVPDKIVDDSSPVVVGNESEDGS